MSPRIEFRKLINSVKYVRNEFLEENARRNPNAPPKSASDRTSKICKISVVDNRADAPALGRLLCKKVTNPRAYLHQGIEIKPGKPYLHSPRIIEARIGRKVRVDALG